MSTAPLTPTGFVIARRGTVGKHYATDTPGFHAVPVYNAAHQTAEALTAWDHLPLHHPIPAMFEEDGITRPFHHRALCGAELNSAHATACWVAGTTLICKACAARVPTDAILCGAHTPPAQYGPIRPAPSYPEVPQETMRSVGDVKPIVP